MLHKSLSTHGDATQKPVKVYECVLRGVCIHAPHMRPFHIKVNPLQSRAGWSFPG